MTDELSGSSILFMFVLAVGFYAVSILFVAWLFSVAFRVRAFLKVLGQIRDELKALNDYNAGRQP